jgi:hypothetical protein
LAIPINHHAAINPVIHTGQAGAFQRFALAVMGIAALNPSYDLGALAIAQRVARHSPLAWYAGSSWSVFRNDMLTLIASRQNYAMLERLAGRFS